MITQRNMANGLHLYLQIAGIANAILISAQVFSLAALPPFRLAFSIFLHASACYIGFYPSYLLPLFAINLI